MLDSEEAMWYSGKVMSHVKELPEELEKECQPFFTPLAISQPAFICMCMYVCMNEWIHKYIPFVLFLFKVGSVYV